MLRPLALIAALLSSTAQASPTGPHAIDTNVAHSDSAPAWITSARVDRVADQIQNKLEWDIRKISLSFYTSQTEFRQAHGFDDTVVAFTRKPQNSVSIGPRVTQDSFDAVFGHELVHVILYQKYKTAVPGWLEEGLANYLSKHGHVNYAWLSQQPDRDVYQLAHPFGDSRGRVPAGGAQYAYQASQALMEMIASHCTVTDLLQLSVGKKLESYLPTLCGINDLNAEFHKWVKRKAASHN
jgi:hypothetical protein